MTSDETEPTIFLIPGHWLGAWAWDDVVEHLRAARHRAIAMTLPGLDSEDAQRSSRTLDDQVDAIERALAQEAATAHRSAVIVAHSGANAPVSMVLDRHPERVRRVVWVDSGPLAPGSVFAPDAPADLEELALPPFEALAAQASLDGLSPDDLERFRRRAVPEPGPVLRQAVTLTDDARLDIPTTLVCCSISSGQIRELAAAGHPMFAEVARLTHVDLVDLPTGHWPMWSRPADLAQVIASAVSPTR
ncbi:alpha/beta fold hydrolase [Agromyces sp. S2-1-8]|uniref:alpha/beta fold hydrolase n=1 Tax=Agromyces sp. S2-1-8 TaxID=2897180 RepID=UPI001E3AC94B|nr:alpha/beta hydrolase [Agromyces sp. S2-1-8]MCD5348133.1 alpha/beta hydrolase [Agromyces sp. S2-1-8]